MTTPNTIDRRRRKNLRRQRHWMAAVWAEKRKRNLMARDLLAPRGPFQPKTKPSHRRHLRRPRHPQRILVEAME